jgi:hypothetical protein
MSAGAACLSSLTRGVPCPTIPPVPLPSCCPESSSTTYP